MNGDIEDKTDDSFDYWVLKFNANDELEWSKTFGGSSNDHGYDIVQTADQGQVILGYSQSNDGDVGINHGLSDAWVIKTDQTGELLWQKSVGGTQFDFAYDAIQKLDNTIIAVGVTESNNGNITENKGGSDLLIIKLK